MKKIRYVVIGIMLIVTLMLSACTFDLGSCGGNKPSGSGGAVEVPGTSDIKLKFEIVEKNTFYYPTLSGKIRFNFYPEKMTISCAGEEKEIKPKGVIYAPSYITGKEEYSYIFTLGEEIFYNRLNKGEYDVVIYGYQGGKKTPNATVTKLTVEKELFLLCAANFETGEITKAMDAEENWIGPY